MKSWSSSRRIRWNSWDDVSKDVEEFKEKVLHWQKRLKTVDSVIKIWVVQKKLAETRAYFLGLRGYQVAAS